MPVDVAEVVVAKGRLGSVGLCYETAEAYPINTNDTVTLSDMKTITAVAAFRLDTGASITATPATNVVTVTQAGLAGVPIVLTATGY